MLPQNAASIVSISDTMLKIKKKEEAETYAKDASKKYAEHSSHNANLDSSHNAIYVSCLSR